MSCQLFSFLAMDIEDGDIFMDLPVEKSKELLDWMEIADDYFTAIAEDLTDEQARTTIKELQKPCDSKTESSDTMTHRRTQST